MDHKQTYTNKIDIWSVGVVLAEMFHGSCFWNVVNGYWSFMQAKDNKCLLDLILQQLGKPKEEVRYMERMIEEQDLMFIEKKEVRAYIEGISSPANPANPVFRNQLSRSIPDDGYDLLMQLLQFNPMKRISASVGVGGKRDMKQEALHHVFFQGLHQHIQPLLCPNQYELEWEEQ